MHPPTQAEYADAMSSDLGLAWQEQSVWSQVAD